MTLTTLNRKAASVGTLMSGVRLGRSERAVRACLTNGILDKADLKLLRNYLKPVGLGG